MKLSGASQAELIKLAGLAIGAGLLLYLGYRITSGAVKSVQDAVNTVLEAPGKAVEAVKVAAREGGAAWQDGYTPNTPPGPQAPPSDPYAPAYKSPMVNSTGMDFGQLSG